MHELTLLINILMAQMVAFIGGVIARRISLSTIVSYLLAGIEIGPCTPGFVSYTETISQLAELGEGGHQSVRMTINTKGY